MAKSGAATDDVGDGEGLVLDAQPTSNAAARTIVAVAVRHARLCRWDFMTPPDYAERTAHEQTRLACRCAADVLAFC